MYPDRDRDGYGDKLRGTTNLHPFRRYTRDGTDCNDRDKNIHPGATELRNAIDDNCDGRIDEGLIPLQYFADADSDGFGNSAHDTMAVVQPTGFVIDSTDCDDTNPLYHVTHTYYTDEDADGYGIPDKHTAIYCVPPDGFVTDSTDCDDTNDDIHPGGTEICNSADDDCDGSIDEGLPFVTYYKDDDDDGYGNSDVSTSTCIQPDGYVTDSTDCNDDHRGGNTIHPGATEVCNGVDDNCNGQIDEGVSNAIFRDADFDGYGDINIRSSYCPPSAVPAGYSLDSTDCDDNNASINPGTFITIYADADNDGYGDAGHDSTYSSCDETPIGWVTDNTDCDDTDPDVHPGAVEICNSIDDNCDGNNDETNRFYADADGDSYGDPSTFIDSCAARPGYVSDNSDCDDTNADVNPGQGEVCTNGIDDNCNGLTDEICAMPPPPEITFTTIPSHHVYVGFNTMNMEGAYYHSTSYVNILVDPFRSLWLALNLRSLSTFGTLAVMVNVHHTFPGDIRITGGAGDGYNCDPIPSGGSDHNHITCTTVYGHDFFNALDSAWLITYHDQPMIPFLNPQMTDTLQMKKEAAWEMVQYSAARCVVGAEEKVEGFPYDSYRRNFNSIADTVKSQFPSCKFVIDAVFWRNTHDDVSWRHSIKTDFDAGRYHVSGSNMEWRDYLWQKDLIAVDTNNAAMMVRSLDSIPYKLGLRYDTAKALEPLFKYDYTQFGSKRGTYGGFNFDPEYDTEFDQFFTVRMFMHILQYNRDSSDYIKSCHYSSINDLINQSFHTDAHYNTIQLENKMLRGAPDNVSYTTTLDTFFHFESVIVGDTVKVLYCNQGTSSININNVTVDGSANITTFTGEYYKGVNYWDLHPNYHPMATSISGIQIQPYSHGMFYFIKP